MGVNLSDRVRLESVLGWAEDREEVEVEAEVGTEEASVGEMEINSGKARSSGSPTPRVALRFAPQVYKSAAAVVLVWLVFAGPQSGFVPSTVELYRSNAV